MDEKTNSDMRELAQAAESKDQARLIKAYENVSSLRITDFVAYMVAPKTSSSEGNNILKAMGGLEDFRNFGEEMSQVLDTNKTLREAFFKKMFGVNNSRAQVGVAYKLLSEMKGLSSEFEKSLTEKQKSDLDRLPKWEPQSQKLQEADIAKASLVQKVSLKDACLAKIADEFAEMPQVRTAIEQNYKKFMNDYPENKAITPKVIQDSARAIKAMTGSGYQQLLAKTLSDDSPLRAVLNVNKDDQQSPQSKRGAVKFTAPPVLKADPAAKPTLGFNRGRG